MCGISGFNFQNSDLAKRMLVCQKHRGPDQEGIYESQEVTLIHNRLSIIDLSERGRQPMWNEKKTIGITFNGEIYNFAALRRNLESKYRFHSNSDTEVILCGYEEYGEKIFEMLEGMWALALYDVARQKLLLSRDYIGIKPLYYYHNGNRLAFASEMKTIKEAGFSLSVDKNACFSFLSFGFIPSPHSIYKEIKKVLPGEIISIDLKNGSLSQRYIPLIPREPRFLDDKNLAAETKEILLESLDRHLVSDVGIGLFLSGGLDSSLLAALLRKERDKKIPVFCLELEGKKDGMYTKEVADLLGLELHLKKVTVKDFEKIYDEVFDGLKEPLADTAIFSSYLVSALAGEKVKVVWSGEGGDELFGGYVTHAAIRRTKNLVWKNKNKMDALVNTLPNIKGKKIIVDKIYSLTHDALGLFLNNLATAHLYEYEESRNYFAKLKDQEPFFYDLFSYLPDRLLYKLDYATMQHSLEGRVPFLDKELVRFALSDGMRERSLRGNGKDIIKEIASAYLPEKILNRKKEGFSVPLGNYFKNLPAFKEDYGKALEWAESELGISVKRIKRTKEKMEFNLVSLYRALR